MGYPAHKFHSTIFRFFLCTSLVLVLSFILPTLEGYAEIPPSSSGLPPGDWDYLIITDSSLIRSFTPLAEHRGAQGLNSRVLSTQELQRYSLQTNLRDAIRWFVATAHRDWGTRYVLLGGDAEIIPVPLGYYENPPFSWDIPLDLYYAAPHGEWDLDGDGLLGEYADDDPDLTPVVALGRAPVSDPGEARSFVNKVIAFEAQGGSDTFDVLLAAEVGLPYPWQPGMEVRIDFARNMEDVASGLATWEFMGAIQRLYQDWESWPGAEPLSPAGFLDALNTGHHRFLGMMTHGNAHTWSLGPDYLRPEDLEALDGMDHSLFMVPAVPGATDCRQVGVLETLLVIPEGGCVGAVGPSALFYIFPADQFILPFWQGMTDNSCERVGDAYRQALASALDFFSPGSPVLATLECMSIFGDPALLILPTAKNGFVSASRVETELVAHATPNPFNPATEISFVLPGNPGTRLSTVVEIFDLGGRRLTRLLEENLEPGAHSVRWRGEDASGRSVGAGLFFARIRAGGQRTVVKLILVE